MGFTMKMHKQLDIVEVFGNNNSLTKIQAFRKTFKTKANDAKGWIAFMKAKMFA